MNLDKPTKLYIKKFRSQLQLAAQIQGRCEGELRGYINLVPSMWPVCVFYKEHASEHAICGYDSRGNSFMQD